MKNHFLKYLLIAAFFQFLTPMLPLAVADLACANLLKQKLRNSQQLNIAVAFGYSDLLDEHLNFVTDGNTLKSFMDKIQKACDEKTKGLCNFKWVKGEAEKVVHFQRFVDVGDGTELEVNLYAANSSYSMFDSDNKDSLKKEQEAKTIFTKKFYFWALQNWDVVFYEGHSRDGGGPDFAPPRANSRGTVDYNWYHENQPGLKWLLQALNTSASGKPAIVGLFSCASRVHFLDSLRKSTPDSMLILSTKVVPAESTKNALMISLESLLTMDCSSSWASKLNGTSFVIENKIQQSL